MQEITITLENSNSSEPTSTTSTQSNSLINSSPYVAPRVFPANNVVSEVWKNRTLENAINLPEPSTNINKTDNRNFASVVAGIYKPSGDSVVKSANASLINTQDSNYDSTNPKKYQRFNTTPDSLKYDKRFNSSRSSIASDSSVNSTKFKYFNNQSGTSSPRIDDSDNNSNTGLTPSSNKNVNRANNNGQRYNKPRSNNYKQNFNRKPNREQQKP